MSYINVGVKVNGNWCPTKKALRIALSDSGASVSFIQTGLYGGSNIRPVDITTSMTLVVVGPDPYTNRKYYANVVLGRDGVLKVT